MVIKSWISALRLRTLPLAISGILMGTVTADIIGQTSWSILFLSLFTALSLQILSNLANDYGDFVKGTDNDNRIGNTRALQSGNITLKQMQYAIVLFVVLSLGTGIGLLSVAFNNQINTATILFFVTGILAIAAAVTYTIGKNPYGYAGLGDLMVFLFFGPVAVTGTCLLHTNIHQSDWILVTAASTCIGLLSTAVLNTNNIRDTENDRNSGKNTIPVKIGLHKARIYHSFLITGSLICVLVILQLFSFQEMLWIALLAFIPIGFQLKIVWYTPPTSLYNKLLKQLSLGTLLLVLLFVLSRILHTIIVVQEIF